MISTDRKLFQEGSDVHSRILEYGKLFEELHVIVFSLRRHGLSKTLLSDNVTVYPTNSFFRMVYVTDAFIIARGILEDIKKKNVVVSTQDSFETGLVGYKIKKKYGIPLQVQVHGDDIANQWFREESLLNRLRLRIADKVMPEADCIRVVSRRIKRALKEAYTLRCEPVLLPIWRDLSGIQKAKISYDLQKEYPQFDFIALTVSRLEREKNISLAIEVFKKVVLHDKKAGLVIVGDGRERSRLELLVRKHGIEKNVIFRGWQNDPVSYYKTADVFLNTSNHEGYCLALIEAASSGCPIITTDVGVVGEVLNESNIFICPVGDRDCLEKKMISAMNNRAILATVSAKARADIEEEMRTKKTYLEEYKESLNVCLKN